MASRKQIRLRRADCCVECGAELAAGDEAIWDPDAKTVTCLSCDAGSETVVEGQPGGSALDEHRRRQQRREQRAREKFGRLGGFMMWLNGEPPSTKNWKQGGDGEVRGGNRLAELLDGSAVKLLHDRRVPGHGGANIDHIAIGPGGVTVIDTKTHKGKIRVNRVGRPLSAHREVLMIGRRDQTSLIVGVERQIEYVRDALRSVGEDQIDVRGALCFPDVGGLPMLAGLNVGEIIVDGPRPVAKLARRPGPLSAQTVERIWRSLAHSFPSASQRS